MDGRGGARNRSGPQPDPESGRSDRRGLVLTALPAQGYDGEIPNFPLPRFTKREIDLWRWAWRTPQAAAWAREPWRWQTVAMWVRWTVRAEHRDETASALTQATRLADQIGLTPAGLRENGWKVAPPEIAPAAAATQDAPARRGARSRTRFAVVDGTAGGTGGGGGTDGAGHPST